MPRDAEMLQAVSLIVIWDLCVEQQAYTNLPFPPPSLSLSLSHTHTLTD